MIDPDWNHIARSIAQTSKSYYNHDQAVIAVEHELRRIFAPLLAGFPASELGKDGYPGEGMARPQVDGQVESGGLAPSPPHPATDRGTNLDIWDDTEWYVRAHSSVAIPLETLRARTDDLRVRLEDLEAKFQ